MTHTKVFPSPRATIGRGVAVIGDRFTQVPLYRKISLSYVCGKMATLKCKKVKGGTLKALPWLTNLLKQLSCVYLEKVGV